VPGGEKAAKKTKALLKKGEDLTLILEKNTSPSPVARGDVTRKIRRMVEQRGNINHIGKGLILGGGRNKIAFTGVGEKRKKKRVAKY